MIIVKKDHKARMFIQIYYSRRILANKDMDFFHFFMGII